MLIFIIYIVLVVLISIASVCACKYYQGYVEMGDLLLLMFGSILIGPSLAMTVIFIMLGYDGTFFDKRIW